MPDFSNRKINLTTPQPGGRKGESPLGAFTKVNHLIDDISAGKTLSLTPWPRPNLNSSPAAVAPGEYTITDQLNRPDNQTGTASWNGSSLLFRTDDGLLFLRQWNAAWSAWSAYRPSGKPAYGRFSLSDDVQVPNATTTYIEFDVALESDNVSINTDVSPSRLKVFHAGLYAVTFRTLLLWPSSYSFIGINGSGNTTPPTSLTAFSANNNHGPQHISGVFRCLGNGRNFLFRVYQNSGTTQSIGASGTYATIARIGEIT